MGLSELFGQIFVLFVKFQLLYFSTLVYCLLIHLLIDYIKYINVADIVLFSLHPSH